MTALAIENIQTRIDQRIDLPCSPWQFYYTAEIAGVQYEWSARSDDAAPFTVEEIAELRELAFTKMEAAALRIERGEYV